MRLEFKTEGDTSQTLQNLLDRAVALGVSDIHGEALEGGAKIRFRIDGLLHDAGMLPPELYGQLLSRIKLLAGIKLNVADRPQDGSFSVQVAGNEIEIRVSTLPSEYGETVVLRLLNPKSLIGFEQLGLRADLLSLFQKEIRKPNGMIVVTGPTGSGKTTTLYAFVLQVKKPELKIITIEDPIEYHLEGISQTQVNESRGYTFASGLRAIVRQDPDIILVGEIRDEETADIALQASLTGHLVFSTLHTNDAAGSVARFVALEAKAATVASAVNLIIAQRLLRKICKKCATMGEASSQEKEKIQKALAVVPAKLRPKVPPALKIPRAAGCPQCNDTGYRGRVGIFEAIEIDDETEEFIIPNPSLSALRNFAIKKGMVPMFQDGILKVLEGVTTLEELERVSAET
ncbi:MAG: type II/IV secretion system protein [Candidatus Wildermuthbacteria bacterium]|nr:type II/IV secretion system protein [Candidatus Wildermuthbacteria bacterium]